MSETRNRRLVGVPGDSLLESRAEPIVRPANERSAERIATIDHDAVLRTDVLAVAFVHPGLAVWAARAAGVVDI